MFDIAEDAVYPGTLKLCEEMSELSVELNKLMTAKSLKYWDDKNLAESITEELADMIAAAVYFTEHNKFIDREKFQNRVKCKLALFLAWHDGKTNATLADFEGLQDQ